MPPFFAMHLQLKQVVVDGALAMFNVMAWGATLMTWASVNQVTGMLSTLAATSVSAGTFFWLRAQAKALARTEAESIERHDRQEENWKEVRRQGMVIDQNAQNTNRIPAMQESMEKEHLLNVGIRDITRETNLRSVPLPDQAAERALVSASRAEVRRVGQMVDKANVGDDAVSAAAAAAADAAAVASAATAATAAAAVKAAATAAAAAVAATAVATAISVAAAAAVAADAATSAVARAADAATAAVAAAAESAATAVAVAAAAAGLPKKG